MSYKFGSSIVTDGLVFYVDAGNDRSYSGTGTIWGELIESENGTLTNGPTYSSTNGGGSFLFDGSDDVCNHGNDSKFNYNLTSALTMEVWMQSDRNTEYQSLISRMENTAPYQGWEFALGPGFYRDELSFVFRNADPNPTNGELKSAYSVSANYVPNTWVNFAVTYDGSGSFSNVNFYKNGSDVGSQIASNNTVSPDVTSTADLTLGGRQTAGTLHGSLAVCKIYNRELSASEILQNYNALKGRFI